MPKSRKKEVSAPDLSKTLTQLEKHDWGPPTYDSNLVRTCHALRYKPLHAFTTRDMYVMIMQDIGLEYLVPLAVAELQFDPLLEAENFEGDLLETVLRCDPQYWLSHPEEKARMRALFSHYEGLFTTRRIGNRRITKVYEAFTAGVCPQPFESRTVS